MVYAAVSQFRCAARGIRGPHVPTAVIRLARSFSSLLKQSRAGDAFAGLLSARHSLALLMLGTLAYAQFPAAPPSMSLRMQVYVFYVFRRLFGRLLWTRMSSAPVKASVAAAMRVANPDASPDPGKTRDRNGQSSFVRVGALTVNLASAHASL
jgi:hypothetical protein